MRSSKFAVTRTSPVRSGSSSMLWTRCIKLRVLVLNDGGVGKVDEGQLPLVLHR